MKVDFCPLASGSRGNCLYLSTKETKILIDVGLSAKKTKSLLSELDVQVSEIDGILVSHEHGDHVRGIKGLAIKNDIPVLANSETARAIYEDIREAPRFQIFHTGEAFQFRDLEIQPFSISHDAMDPVAFTIKAGKMKIGICTDLGIATPIVQHHLKGCDCLYLEANHDPALVANCPRPAVYKQRVVSRSGHLSNEDAGKLLKQIWHPKLQHVYLAHLSSECNDPELAIKTVRENCQESPLELSVALQDGLSKRMLLQELVTT